MILPSQALVAIPAGLRQPLVDAYTEIARNFSENRWEPAELNGGKFCEVVYCVIEGALKGNFAIAPSKPAKILDACQGLERMPSSSTRPGDRSLRILIPRMLPVLYEIRNNCGVGHVGGEVNPNHQDATAVYQMSSWIMAELIRIFHQISLSDAQETVDALVERKHPIVWRTGDVRRVLGPDFPKSDQSLILLYSENNWIEDRVLAKWVEYQNLSQYRTAILNPLHVKRIIEYDSSARKVVRITTARYPRCRVETAAKL